MEMILLCNSNFRGMNMEIINQTIVKWGVCPYCKKATEFSIGKCPGCGMPVSFSEIIEDE